LTRNPIRKVLLTLRSHGVRYLLMGGQACVFYGGAEFSRDTDITLLASPVNLSRLKCALRELQAECIAVPPLKLEYLLRGHAVHFRCRHPEADGMRLDVMARMRGLPDFKVLWKRRTTITIRPSEIYELLSLPDLIAAKKTQRDKDWLMIRRLVEAHYYQYYRHPTRSHVSFWLMNSRTTEYLTAVSDQYPRQRMKQMADRKLLAFAEKGREKELTDALIEEEQSEQSADRQYWAPLKAELETLRHLKVRQKIRS